MPNTCKQLKIRRFFIFFLMAAILAPFLSPSTEARRPVRWRAKKTVVVDPGHGGQDSGARGSSGVLEKDVTLDLAQKIEAVLENRFRVHLTRTDDYGLELIRRTDAANHLKADVFVSIHAGGSFQHDARGMRVFYFRENRSDATARSSAEMDSWDRLQQKHAPESKILAEFLKNRFDQALPDIGCQIDAAPLLVLRGADMPAVLIEVGTLTNTEDEKRLKAEDNLTLLARMTAAGIGEFLRKGDAGPDQ